METLPPALLRDLMQRQQVVINDGAVAEGAEGEAEELHDAMEEGAPTRIIQPGEEIAECAVCLCEMEPGQKVRKLPCNHKFHAACIAGIAGCT